LSVRIRSCTQPQRPASPVARARQRASPTGPGGGGVASSPLAPRTRTVTVTVGAHHRQRRLRKPGLRMGRPPKTVKSLSRSGPGPLRWFKVAFRVQLLHISRLGLGAVARAKLHKYAPRDGFATACSRILGQMLPHPDLGLAAPASASRDVVVMHPPRQLLLRELQVVARRAVEKDLSLRRQRRGRCRRAGCSRHCSALHWQD
jgi:hypothetical protein